MIEGSEDSELLWRRAWSGLWQDSPATLNVSYRGRGCKSASRDKRNMNQKLETPQDEMSSILQHMTVEDVADLCLLVKTFAVQK